MTRLKYNLDKITSFTVAPGKYRAKLVKVEQTLSSKKKPMLVWYWKIMSGSEKGKEVRSWTSLQENALGGLKQHLEAFRLKGQIDRDTSSLVGKYVVLIVGTRIGLDANGQEREMNSITSFIPDGDSNDEDEEEMEEDADTEEEEDEDEDEEDSEEEDEDEEDEEDDDEDEDEDDEEEEEPEPRRRKSTVKPSAKSPVSKSSGRSSTRPAASKTKPVAKKSSGTSSSKRGGRLPF